MSKAASYAINEKKTLKIRLKEMYKKKTEVLK